MGYGDVIHQEIRAQDAGNRGIEGDIPQRPGDAAAHVTVCAAVDGLAAPLARATELGATGGAPTPLPLAGSFAMFAIPRVT